MLSLHLYLVRYPIDNYCILLLWILSLYQTRMLAGWCWNRCSEVMWCRKSSSNFCRRQHFEMNCNQTSKFKKVHAKKLVKSNKSRKFFMKLRTVWSEGFLCKVTPPELKISPIMYFVMYNSVVLSKILKIVVPLEQNFEKTYFYSIKLVILIIIDIGK